MLADFGVNVKDTDTVKLSVKSAQLQALADNDIQNLLRISKCVGAIPKSTVLLVRGYILGQRTFLLKNEKANDVKGNIPKIASFNVSVGSGDASLNLTDDAEVKFLQIVSQVTIAPTSTNLVAVTKPEVIGGTGRVYVQRDRADLTNKAKLIVDALRAASFNVVSKVETVDSARMPKAAQVRYFNESDKPMAEGALREFQKQFPNASIVRIGLPAPSGQLEIWLPKAQG
jgi:hypothetical protein